MTVSCCIPSEATRERCGRVASKNTQLCRVPTRIVSWSLGGLGGSTYEGLQLAVLVYLILSNRAYCIADRDGGVLPQRKWHIVPGYMTGMLSKVYATIKTSCFGERYKGFLVSFGGLLVNADHLASATRS